MQTGAISFRVVDFLKQHPPFQFMEEPDLLALVGRGRVRFHEADEYLQWQGSSHGSYVSVIQQGTASLWQDQGEGERLRDILGAGDLLNVDYLLSVDTIRYSAKSQSEVVLYALPAADFAQLVAKYPQARQFIDSHASVLSSYQAADHRRGAHETYLHEVAQRCEPLTCVPEDSVREAVRRMMRAGDRAIAVVNADKLLQGVATLDRVLESIASNELDLQAPVEGVMDRAPCVVRPDAFLNAAVLAMTEADSDIVAITEDGATGSRLHGLLSASSLTPSFGDQPAALYHDIAHAPNTAALRAVQQRAREFVLSQLSSPAAMDWLARLSCLADCRILARVAEWNPPPGEVCWCLYGAAGRQEVLAPVLPEAAVIFEDAGSQPEFTAWYRRVQEQLLECGYVTPAVSFDRSLACASIAEWQDHFRGWVDNPVLNEMYQARPLFDLRPVLDISKTSIGRAGGVPDLLWQRLNSTVRDLIRADRDFLPLLAHDCFANLPPLTFFRDVVVEESGERSDVFQLEQTALRPLVDVGRVFGIAAGGVLGASTLERLMGAKRLLPEKSLTFLEATETLRVVLLLQARIGIRQQSAGFELPPALLSHHDRQVLKSGFRSILELLEVAKNYSWPEAEAQ
jgi:CBS domain-containing protein